MRRAGDRASPARWGGEPDPKATERQLPL